MNDVKDTIATLMPDAQKMAKEVLRLSRRMFDDHGKVEPCAFAWKTGGEKMEVMAIPNDMMSPENKPMVWGGVALLRQNCPIVGFVSEVWMSKVKPEDFNKEDGTVKVMPRDDPNHIEHVMFQLWQGRRSVTFFAKIGRKPDRLENWNVMFDSDFPDSSTTKADRVSGQMMEGEPFPLEDN